MPSGTNHYIAEILTVRIERFEVFASTPEEAAEAAQRIGPFDDPPSFRHVCINITAAPGAAEETNDHESNEPTGTERRTDEWPGEYGDWHNRNE